MKIMCFRVTRCVNCSQAVNVKLQVESILGFQMDVAEAWQSSRPQDPKTFPALPVQQEDATSNKKGIDVRAVNRVFREARRWSARTACRCRLVLLEHLV